MASDPLPRLRVLMVENYPPFASLLRETLRLRAPDLQVASATSVAEVVERLGDAGASSGPAFDLILTDFHLHDGSALDILRLLGTPPLRIPLVVLTGDEDAALRRQVLDAGASAVLIKAGDFLARLPQVLRDVVAAADRQ